MARRKSSKPAGNRIEFRSAWQREYARCCQQAGWPLAVPLSDRLGWLYLAIDAGATDEAKRFIDSGVEVNAPHERGDGSTCLELAATKGNLEVVQHLVRHGADVNHEGKEGTALTCAARSGQTAVYEYLKPLTDRRHQVIAARRLPEALRPEAERVRTIRFSEVCLRGLLPTVRGLLRQGIDVDARTTAYTGKTPLTLASQAGHTEIVELLLAARADPGKESYNGKTPLMGVANADICRMLLRAGADVNAADDNGRTVLMWVTDAECCRLLLEAGARTDALDGLGRGVLPHVAWWVKRRQEFGWPTRSVINARYDHNLAEIFRLLIAAGAHWNVPTEDIEKAVSDLAGLGVPEAIRVLSAAAGDG